MIGAENKLFGSKAQNKLTIFFFVAFLLSRLALRLKSELLADLADARREEPEPACFLKR